MCWMIWLRPSAWLAALSAAPSQRSGAGRQEPVFRSVGGIACRFAIRIRLTVGAAGIKFRKTGDGTDRVNLSALGEPERPVLRC